MQDKDTLNALCSAVSKSLNRESADPDIAIGELGLDSMRVVELILICDQLYDASIETESIDLTQFTTLRELDQQFNEMPKKTKVPAELV